MITRPTTEQRRFWSMCAQLSQAAYEDLDEFKSRFPSADVNLIEAKDSQFFTVRWPGRAVVAIRGTQFLGGNPSWTDIWRNFKVKKRLVPGLHGRVHEGYFDGWCAVSLRVSKFIGDCRRDGIPVAVTGHSLGGVTAQIVAAEFPSIKCVAFGSPRAGDAEFAEYLSNVDRLYFATDGAGSVPPMSFGYRHGGTRWQLARTGVIYQGGEWKDLLPLGFPYHDHDVDNYVNLLRGVNMIDDLPKDRAAE